MDFQVRATDSDDSSTDSNRFNVTVDPVNDPPTAKILNPAERESFKKKEYIIFEGEGLDVDFGDELNLTWKDGDDILGHGPTINVAGLATGPHNITLEVKVLAGEKATAHVTIKVKKAKKPGSNDLLPGFDTAVAATSIGVVAVLLAFFRGRDRDR